MIASSRGGMSVSTVLRPFSPSTRTVYAVQRRSFSQQTAKSSVKPTIKRGTLRKKIEHENKLRQAITLYHGSHAFFPSIATRAGQERIGMTTDEAAAADREHDRLPVWAGSEAEKAAAAESSEGASSSSAERIASHDEQLDEFIRSTLTNSLKAIKADTQRRGGVYMRTANMTLDYVHQSRAESAAHSSADDFDATLARQGRVDHLFNYRQTPPSPSSATDKLPARDDAEGIKAYLAEATRRTADVMRQSVGGSGIDAVRSDNRTARVRDALFGTVQGSLPGLEVVRERARDARVRKEAERLAQEQHDRQAGLS